MISKTLSYNISFSGSVAIKGGLLLGLVLKEFEQNFDLLRKLIEPLGVSEFLRDYYEKNRSFPRIINAEILRFNFS